MKSVFVETYGCQMNVYDTELVKTILKTAKYRLVESEKEADIVMLNTCSVRENANRKIYERIHELKSPKKGRPQVMVGVLGCMATNFRKALLEDPTLKLDFIAGPDSYKQLPSLLSAVQETGEKSFDVTLSEFETYSDIDPTRKQGVNAWIAVMRGCNNFCTFCVVPYTRGRERSRAPESVVDEVKRLVDSGFSQVTLLGQNVNSYRHEKTDFADLMALVAGVKGVKRIRFTSPHPKDFPKKLLEVMAGHANICKSVHLPLQAGNDRILDKMNRTYTQKEFFQVVEDVRSWMPEASLTTDIIVGFPTETDEEFEDTYHVMKTVQFDAAFMFKYSERPGTLASKRFSDDVPVAIKTERIVRLVDLQKKGCLDRNTRHVGGVRDVMIEEVTSKKDPTMMVGRTDTNVLVLLPKGPYKVGDIVAVRIASATPHILRGVPL